MSKVIELVSSGHRILTLMSPTLKPVLSSAYQAVSYDGINRMESIERQKERGRQSSVQEDCSNTDRQRLSTALLWEVV